MSVAGAPAQRHSLSHAPGELTSTRLKRLGEGIGKIVYASEHWVVKRERSPSAIISLIVIWKFLRRLERHLPGFIGRRLVDRPARQIRWLRMAVEGVVLIVPRGFWFMTHIGEVWSLYSWRDVRGERLADIHLSGTSLIPERIQFPPTRVRVAGWPGYLNVTEAVERVEATLDQRISDLAAAGHLDEVAQWLDRFLSVRQQGWRRGVFSTDAHLKNFGVIGDRIVLLDAGGLTNCWDEIESRLSFEENVREPHVQLGLGSVLIRRPDIATRFDEKWKEIVTREGILRHWPSD